MEISGEKTIEIVKLSHGWLIKVTDRNKTLMETMTSISTMAIKPNLDTVIFFSDKQKLSEWLDLNL